MPKAGDGNGTGATFLDLAVTDMTGPVSAGRSVGELREGLIGRRGGYRIRIRNNKEDVVNVIDKMNNTDWRNM